MKRLLGDVLRGLVGLAVVLLLIYAAGVLVGVFWLGVCSMARCW